MELKEIEKLIKLCKKYGIKSINLSGISMELDLSLSPTSNRKSQIAKDLSPAPTPEQPLTEEEILYWSSGGFGEDLKTE
jgi:hypothetical protein